MDNIETSKPFAKRLLERRDKLFGTSSDLPRIIEVDLDKLRPNPYQPRKTFNEEALQELAASIEERGLIQPIAVAHDPENSDCYIVVAGERRYRAHQKLGRQSIPAIVTSGNPDEIALIENIQREDLHPLEEAEALQGMMERHGYTQVELSKVVGKARNTINEILRLNTLPEDIKERCRALDTPIPKTILLQVARIESSEEQRSFWNEIQQGEITWRIARSKKQTKERGGTIQTRISPVRRVLSSGRSFAHSLEELSPTTLSQDREGYLELIELRKRINEIYDSMNEQVSK